MPDYVTFERFEQSNKKKNKRGMRCLQFQSTLNVIAHVYPF